MNHDRMRRRRGAARAPLVAGAAAVLLLAGCVAGAEGVAESPVVPTTRIGGAPAAVIFSRGADPAVHFWQV